MQEKYKQIKKIFKNNGGYARTKNIIEAGIHTSYLYQLVDNNTIERIKRGLYHWNNDEFSNREELVKISKIVPKGVVCLLSALDYYDVTTQNPWEYYIAIYRRDHKPVLPDYPPIRIFYFSRQQFEAGLEEVKINNNIIQIYNLEKTLCDCLRLRNKIGMDVVKEALKEYVTRQDRNISKLLEYAEITNVQNLMQKYLEVLV
jgi:predicted transcriptional regulator of viral defense system